MRVIPASAAMPPMLAPSNPLAIKTVFAASRMRSSMPHSVVFVFMGPYGTFFDSIVKHNCQKNFRRLLPPPFMGGNFRRNPQSPLFPPQAFAAQGFRGRSARSPSLRTTKNATLSDCVFSKWCGERSTI